MSVLVTGGAGYIGSVAVERLLAEGEQVVVLDSLATGHRAAVSKAATFIQGDILDRELVRHVLAQHDVDTVMHFAAFIEVKESCENPRKYFQNNTAGAMNLLDTMLDAGVDKFIFSSTAAVYGNPGSTPITEDAPTRPINPYGLSKRMVEQILEWYACAHGLRYVALRYFNASGATIEHGEAHHPETHLIPNVLLAAEGKKDIVVYGKDWNTPDGTCIRDYIHVLDLAGAHLLAMRHLRNGGGSDCFNLGNGEGYSVLEVVEAVKRVTGRNVPLTMGGRRAGDPERLVASSEKARRVLQWQPTRGDIDTIVRDAWNWRQIHPAGYAG
ncbi:MAG: UDP-glucose 4-epimerase GalE [Candidatus Hydrogenedentes bacterium]|nr:UDP-glucose 4-epimerase GalE [Candidatus Hydrogenedentota bacterium]